LTFDQLGLLKRGKHAANNDWIGIQLERNISRGLQCIRFRSKQNQYMDPGSKSAVDSHARTLP